jgi:RNA polymerase sigma-70 factor (ECF subfamily)
MERDEELVGRLARGEEAALAELLRRWERPLSAFLHRHTGGRDVDDLYQETWMRVVRHAGRFDRGKRFSTWLFQIAVNLCRDWHRRRGTEPLVGEGGEAASVSSMARTEAGLDAARLLARLPEPQREVVMLRYYHDLGEEEVAEILGCPRGTVKSRMHNALARLSEMAGERKR